MTGVKAVCFDLDGTLLRDDHVDEVVRAAGDEAARRFGLDSRFVDDAVRALHAYWFGVGESPLLSTVPTDGLPVDVWAAALRARGVVEPDAAASVYRRQIQLEARAARLYDESLEVLAAVRSRGLRTAVITNGPSDLQRGKLDTVGLDGFDAVIVSGEAGHRKPERAIFALALAALGVDPDEAVHVGDNQVADVGGARGAGLTSVWINRNGAAAASDPHHTVTDLRELLPLL
ncbi:HAD family hydrolase [Microbacterium sp. SSM24]|uniref:HAD family hydrolase n=1 Tax=Microbacterium sp. SSM24 TaxID=2991714 RepID=UPI002226827C|nr:HAD family hydrolase [Microbacterium sp. SSM24]MCW3491773.1 HAD family hydrolase [Microbacterium sp. SSM24]